MKGGIAICLVSGPGVEIGVYLLQIDRQLGDRLGPIDHDHGAGGVRLFHDRGDRVDRAEHVRDMDQGEQPWAAREQRVERVGVEVTVVEHGHVGELGIALLTDQLGSAGMSGSDALAIATTTVAAMEGALILCRARGNVAPLDAIATQLDKLVTTRT